MFQVSDKVVCVGLKNKATNPLPKPSGYPSPQKGQTYVIRDVWCCSRASEGYMIQLVGFDDVYWGEFRRGWTPSAFRKLSDIKAENALKNKQTEPVKVNR